MNDKPNLQAIKSANGERKRLLQCIHRIIDDHRSGKNDAHCMKMIRHVLRRGQPGRGHELAGDCNVRPRRILEGSGEQDERA